MRVNSGLPTHKLLPITGRDQLNKTKEPTKSGKLNSKEKWKRNKESMLLGKLKLKKFGQLNSKLFSNHGVNLLLTLSIIHNLLPGLLKRKLKLVPTLTTLLTKLLILMRLSSEMSLTITTLSVINNVLLKKMLRLTSKKNKPSMLNTLRPGITKWRTFTLKKLQTVTGKSLLTTELKFLTTGMRL